MLDEIAGLILPGSPCLAVVKAMLSIAEGSCLAEVAMLEQALADERAKVAALLRELNRLEEAELEARRAAELHRKVTRTEEARRERDAVNAELRRKLARLEEAEREREVAGDELRALISVETQHHADIHDHVDG